MFRWKLVGSGAGALVGLVVWSAVAQYPQGRAPAPAVGQYPQARAQVYAPQAGGGGEFFAPNLGVYYRLVPYNAGGGYVSPGGNYDPANPPGGGGYAAPSPFQQAPYPGPPTYGARLTRYPVANSAAANLQLEPGDMIVSLDNLSISNPNDVLNHRFATSMVFVNVRTGLPQPAQVYLP